MNKACIIIDDLKEMVVSLKWIVETKGTVNLVQDVYTSGWPTISGNTNNYLPVSLEFHK